MKEGNVLDLMGGYAFWIEACQVMAHNICAALQLAGMELTPRHIVRFAQTMPLGGSDLTDEQWVKGDCNRCLELVFEKSRGTENEEKANAIFDYFCMTCLERSRVSQVTLRDAIVGVVYGLGGVEQGEPS